MSGNSFTNCKPKTSFYKYFTTLNKCFRNIFEQRTISTCLSPPELLTLEKMSGRPPTCKQKYGVLLSQSKERERGSKHGGCDSGGEKVGAGGIKSSPRSENRGTTEHGHAIYRSSTKAKQKIAYLRVSVEPSSCLADSRYATPTHHARGRRVIGPHQRGPIVSLGFLCGPFIAMPRDAGKGAAAISD